jgi:uncharacterized Zn ribbon protein
MGSRIDIFFPNKGEFIHTIIDRSNIRIGGAGTSGGGVCAPVVFSVNSTEVKTVQSGSPYNLDIINSALQSVGIFAGDKVTVQDGQVVVKDSAGNTLYTVNVASNGAVNRPVGDSVVEVRDTAGAVLYTVSVLAEGSDFRVVGNSTVNVRRSDNSLIEAKTVKAQGTETATVADSTVSVRDSAGVVLHTVAVKAASTEVQPVSDSTVNVRKSDGVLIAAVPVKAQATVPYDVANSTVTMKDTAGATLDSKSVKATESAELTAPNATAPIKDSAGALLKTEVFKSGETRDVGISDSSVAVKDSAGATLHTKTVKAQGTAEQVVSDSVLTLNSGAFLNVKAEASQNIQLLSSVDNSPIVPASVVGAVIKVAVGAAPVAPYMAYGLRKLISTYTGSAAVVRRDSDNTTSNIGFSGNDFNVAAFDNFVGGGLGFCRDLFNQAGGIAVNAFGSATLGNQPQIVTKGTKKVIQGRGAIEASFGLSTGRESVGSGTYIHYLGYLNTGFTVSFVMENVAGNVSNYLLYSGSPLSLFRFSSLSALGLASSFAVSNSISVGNPTNLRHALLSCKPDKTYVIYLNGVQVGSGTFIEGLFPINTCILSGGAQMAEYMAWNRNLETSEVTTLWSQIQTYYGL